MRDNSSGDNVSLSCSFSSEPPSLVQWRLAGRLLTNSSHYRVLQYGDLTRTSVLHISHITAAHRGIYQCRAANQGGQVADTRTVVVVDHDIMEQLVKLKLYVMAGVGGCIVLLSSFIAASCIYHVRSKETLLQSCKYGRHHSASSWSDSDTTDSRPFFRFHGETNGWEGGVLTLPYRGLLH